VKKFAIAAIFAASAINAHAESWFQYEAGIGINHYWTTNGRWYQINSPENDTNFTSLALKAGVQIPLYEREDWGVRAHVDYVHLGHTSTHCVCTPDANYSLKQERVINTSVQGANLSGNGNAQGVILSLEYFRKWRGLEFGFEGGLFPYRPSFDVGAYWYENNTYHTYHTPNALRLGGMIGVNVSYKQLTVSVDHFILPTPSNNPAVYNDATALFLTYKF